MAHQHLDLAARMQEYTTKSTNGKYQKYNYRYCHENNRCGCERFANTECPGVSNCIALTTFRFENFFGGPSTCFSWSEFQTLKSQPSPLRASSSFELGDVSEIHMFPLAQHIDGDSTQKFWTRIFEVKSCLSMPFESLIATSRNCKCNFV